MAVKHDIKFVLVAALLAVFAVSGCSTLDGIGGTNDAPAIQVGNTQVWYGRVNTWAMDEGLLKADMEKITKNKKVTGYMIELLSWGQYSAYTSDKAAWKAKTESAYKLLVKEARARGKWVFVSIANDNSGSGKYGDKSPVLEKQADLLDWGLKLVLAQGPKNVIVQPVAETGRSWSKNWEVAAAKALRASGFKTVCNTGSRPSRKPSWADWNAWHPYKVTDKVPGDQIIVTDTGMIIQQLCVGLEGPMKPAAVAAYGDKMRASGVPVWGMYHFKYLGSDPAIEALRGPQEDDLDWIGAIR